VAHLLVRLGECQWATRVGDWGVAYTNNEFLDLMGFFMLARQVSLDGDLNVEISLLRWAIAAL
jgi:hypothetical protein